MVLTPIPDETGGSQHKRGNFPPRSSGACRVYSFGRFFVTRVRLLDGLLQPSEKPTRLRPSALFSFLPILTVSRFIVSGRRNRHERLLGKRTVGCPTCGSLD